jgi:hypothetical protein
VRTAIVHGTELRYFRQRKPEDVTLAAMRAFTLPKGAS